MFFKDFFNFLGFKKKMNKLKELEKEEDELDVILKAFLAEAERKAGNVESAQKIEKEAKEGLKKVKEKTEIMKEIKNDLFEEGL